MSHPRWVWSDGGWEGGGGCEVMSKFEKKKDVYLSRAVEKWDEPNVL